MGHPLIPPDPLQLATGLRHRLEQLLPFARSGRGRDLDSVVESLEAAIRELGALSVLLAARSGGAEETATADGPALRQELAICRGLAAKLAQLIGQARELRLAHWTPETDGSYTASGGPAPASGPRLVRQLG